MFSRQNNFELLVSLKAGQASGKLFWDDGESIDTIASGQYQINTFQFANVKYKSTINSHKTNKSFFFILQNVLTITVTKGAANWPGIVPKMDQIYVMGFPARPAAILIDGVAISSSDYSYDANKRLAITASLDMNVNHVITFQ